MEERSERCAELLSHCLHHVINGERCSQASARSWSKTNLATSSRDMVPPWKSERSVSARIVSRLGLLFRTEGRTRTQSSPLSLTIVSCRFLSAYTLRKRSGKIRLSKRKPPCPALSPAPIPVMHTRRETCAAFIALTSARVAVERTVTSRKGLAGVPSALTT